MAEIPTDPRLWVFGDADNALKTALDEAVGKDGFKANRAFMDGDHWQDGIWWAGPGRDSLGALQPSVRTRILQQFTPCPEGPKCVRRRVNGACATEADFSAIPNDVARDDNGNPVLTAEEQREADAWQLSIGAWWNDRGVWGKVRKCVEYATIGTGACLRLFWNPNAVTLETDAAGQARQGIRVADRDEGFRILEIDAPPPDSCGIYLHPDTLQEIGIVRYKVDDKDGMQLWWVEGDTTWFRVHKQGEVDAEPLQFKWGGLLPIIPLEDVAPIFTDPVRRLQGALDTSNTALVRLTEAHGYAQRDEINAEPAGEWKTEAPPTGTPQPVPPKEIDGTTHYLWPGPRELGNGVTNTIVGIEHTISIDETSSKETVGLTTPQVLYHEPSNPESIIKGKDQFKADIRSACYQGHISDDSTAQLSGDAYEQKRSEFESDINGAAQGVSRQTARTLSTATVMADWAAGADTPEFALGWTVDVQVEADAGPESSEKQRGAGEAVGKGLLSKRTYLVRHRIQDVDAELERIADDTVWEVEKTRAELLKLLIDAGWDAEAANRKAGYTDEEIKAAMRNDAIPPEQ